MKKHSKFNVGKIKSGKNSKISKKKEYKKGKKCKHYETQIIKISII